MFWPWQIASNFLSLNFVYKLDFSCDAKKVFVDQTLFNNQEIRRKKFKKIILFFYYFFYHYPKRLLKPKINKRNFN